MKKKIKVWLQYPWKFPDSPYYKYLIDNPPKNIEYLNVKKQKGVITKKSKFLFSNFLKRNIRKITNTLKLPLPNAHLTKTKKEYDLIHCAHCLSKNKDKPWVADMERIWSLWISGMKTKLGKKRVKKILMNKNCKKILSWTEHTKNEIIKVFPEIKNKIETIYPAVPIQKRKKKTKKDKITVIYAARYFYLKGGLIAVKAYEKLMKKYPDVEFIFISDAPNNIKKRTNVKIRELVSQKELFEIYQKSDIFFYPSFVDTFGFGLLEAMSFGLPVVTVNTPHTQSRDEIIKEGYNGSIFNVKKMANQKKLGERELKIVDKLVKNCSKLIENRKLISKMSKNCQKEIKSGKFSIKKRNDKLSKIYEEIL